MGGPGLEVAKFTFYVFMPLGFMIYFGGPGFYERYVADDAYKFNSPPKVRVPTDKLEINKMLGNLEEAREQRRILREKTIKEWESQALANNPSSET